MPHAHKGAPRLSQQAQNAPDTNHCHQLAEPKLKHQSLGAMNQLSAPGVPSKYNTPDAPQLGAERAREQTQLSSGTNLPPRALCRMWEMCSAHHNQQEPFRKFSAAGSLENPLQLVDFGQFLWLSGHETTQDLK